MKIERVKKKLIIIITTITINSNLPYENEGLIPSHICAPQMFLENYKSLFHLSHLYSSYMQMIRILI